MFTKPRNVNTRETNISREFATTCIIYAPVSLRPCKHLSGLAATCRGARTPCPLRSPANSPPRPPTTAGCLQGHRVPPVTGGCRPRCTTQVGRNRGPCRPPLSGCLPPPSGGGLVGPEAAEAGFGAGFSIKGFSRVPRAACSPCGRRRDVRQAPDPIPHRLQAACGTQGSPSGYSCPHTPEGPDREAGSKAGWRAGGCASIPPPEGGGKQQAAPLARDPWRSSRPANIRRCVVQRGLTPPNPVPRFT